VVNFIAIVSIFPPKTGKEVNNYFLFHYFLLGLTLLTCIAWDEPLKRTFLQ
jgi:hypothetical protein